MLIDQKEIEGAQGARLDSFLAKHLGGLSRAKIQKMIKNEQVLVNRDPSKSNYVLKCSDKVWVKDAILEKADLPAADLKSEDFNFSVLFEDENILCIDKPAGVVVHPDSDGNHSSGTVLHAVLSKLSFKQGIRPGIVHRLDKDTSGILLIAKDEAAQEYLLKQFKNRLIQKKYLALIKGIPKDPEGIINAPITRSLSNRKKMAITSDRAGKEAISIYKILKTFSLENKKTASLVEVEIKTGRTHQIRVHFQAIGHPVIGDNVYGQREINQHFLKNFGLNRQFLHAWKISFVNLDGRKISLESKMPSLLEGIIFQLRKA